MDQLSDLELVQEVRNGKRQAFTELMRRYQQRVYWTARRIVGRHEDADDVTQETFIKAYLALGDFRGDSSFFTWLYRIALNLSLNAVRKQQMLKYLRQSDIINRILPARANPDQELEAKETESRLQQAIAFLPEKQKAVFVMRYYDGMSYEDISKVLKTSVGGLKANYFHALRKIQEFIKDEI
ncbi:MAG: sigma-70 family RNA polymerase sigma factor [Ignavibacteria bacterium]|nr:sigma-70 family RNA polymerase sigma factor [Ignavibacteria bacterium]